jgi:hypothetical protein
MPPMFPDIERLVNTGQRVDALHQPLWWSQETAFLAFLPINPDFFGVPFEDFNNAELRNSPTGYSMRAEASLTWKQTEFIFASPCTILLTCTECLKSTFGADSAPWYPVGSISIPASSNAN